MLDIGVSDIDIDVGTMSGRIAGAVQFLPKEITSGASNFAG